MKNTESAKEKKSVPSEPCGKPPQSPAKETEGTGYPLQPGKWEGVYFPLVQRRQAYLQFLT